MAALTGPKGRKTQDGEAFRSELADGLVSFGGAYGSGRTKTHPDVVAGGVTEAGKLAPYKLEPGFLPFGFFDTPAGDETNESDARGSLTGDGVKDTLIRLESGRVMDLEVAGATDNLSVFEPVFFIDDGTPTLTVPANASIQHGIVLSRRGAGSTTKTVSLLYSADHMIAQSLAGGTKHDHFLGHFDWSDLADGIIFDGKIAHNHGTVVGLYAVVDVATTGAGGTSTISLTIDDTPIAAAPVGIVDVSTTGIVIPTATAKGTRIDIAALDGAGDETYHGGFELNVVAKSTGGTLTTGTFNLYMTVLNKPGY